MSLENLDVIDMAIPADDSWLELVISDSGMIRDEARRMELLRRKMLLYASYISSRQFSEDHPETDRTKVRLRVVSPRPYASKLDHITISWSGDTIVIPVQLFTLPSI